MGREQTDGGPVSHMLNSSGAKSSLWRVGSQGVREWESESERVRRERGEEREREREREKEREREIGWIQYPFSFHLCHSLQHCELN